MISTFPIYAAKCKGAILSNSGTKTLMILESTFGGNKSRKRRASRSWRIGTSSSIFWYVSRAVSRDHLSKVRGVFFIRV